MNFKVESNYSYNETLERLQKETVENGFRVLHIHNVQQTLKEKGFEIDEYSIVEVCNAKFANSVLGINKEFGVMMPCKIIVYNENGKTFLLLPLPTALVERFGMNTLYDFAKEVENILINIVNQTIK